MKMQRSFLGSCVVPLLTQGLALGVVRGGQHSREGQLSSGCDS